MDLDEPMVESEIDREDSANGQEEPPPPEDVLWESDSSEEFHTPKQTKKHKYLGESESDDKPAIFEVSAKGLQHRVSGIPLQTVTTPR